MSNKDQGKRGVVVQMDVPRTFRWTIRAVEEFEDLAAPLLTKYKITKPDDPFTVRGILGGIALDKPSILVQAVRCAAGISEEEARVALDESADLKTVKRALLRSYPVAEDPSLAASLDESWRLSDQMDDLATKAKTLEAQKILSSLKSKVAPEPAEPESDLSSSA